MYIYVHVCINPERREAPGVAERLGRHLALAVLHVPYTLDSGRHFPLPHYN